MIKLATIRIMLSLAVTDKWDIQQIYINNAFINGNLEEEIYMVQPLGFISSDKTQVSKLHKSLYGLKQAPRAWYDRLKIALHQFGFTLSKCDPSLFVHSSLDVQLFALVYVDDSLITGSATSLIHDLIRKLHATFALNHMDKPDYFLGIEVKYQANGSIILTQEKYIRGLLHKASMIDCKCITTPMASTTKLSRFGLDKLPQPHNYRSLVSALQYITLTRPEISYSVRKVCQFLVRPLETHWRAVKCILRYLSNTAHHGLLLQPAFVAFPLTLCAYSDFDWGSDPDDRRSTFGSCIFLGQNLIS